MKKYFDYSESKYNEKSSNIAVFTKTPTLIHNKSFCLDIYTYEKKLKVF